MTLPHFTDNARMDQNDKLWKLHPLIKKFKRNFREHFDAIQQ